jgi:Ser/Thr protein kinase RdoA (MazF antagonist)
MPLDIDAARRVVAALDLDEASLGPLGQGFASEAWLVRTVAATYVLRVERADAGYPSTYRAEHGVMTALADRGAAVPRPVAGSWSLRDWDGPAFSLTTQVAGGETSNDVLAGAIDQVAAFVRELQAIPVTGFGPLVDRDDHPVGVEGDLRGGLLARFEDGLWPIGPRPLRVQPALAGHPALAASIDRHAGAVRAAMAEGPFVLVHSDLHGENILSEAGRLAFIDFGETFVGTAAWEVATFAYFTSWALADALVAELARDGLDVARVRRSASLLALSWGLIRWEQDRGMALDTDAYNEGFLRQSLARIETATIGPMEIMGVQIRTIVHDNVARRCNGCLEIIDGTPWRVNLLDIVASESPVAWTERPVINPGPFQFHGDPACVRRWMGEKDYLFCRRGEVREIMRPIAIPGETVRWGLCDGIHRDDHEFVPA